MATIFQDCSSVATHCVKDASNNVLVCPECKARQEAKNGEKSFTQNRFLLSQIRRKVTGKKCEEHGEELILYCREYGCKTQICRLYVREHQKHQIVDIEEEIKDAINRKVDGIVNILETRMKMIPILQENLAGKNLDCVRELEKKKEEINQKLDTIIT